MSILPSCRNPPKLTVVLTALAVRKRRPRANIYRHLSRPRDGQRHSGKRKL